MLEPSTTSGALVPILDGARLLGHSSIQTAGDIYACWDIDQITRTLASVLASDESVDA